MIHLHATVNHKPAREGIPYGDSYFTLDALAVEHHGGRAGLQLADVVASAFYQGVNTVSPKWAIEPAAALRPIVARDKSGDKSNFGVTVWPLAHQAPVPEASRGVFERFGYRFG